MRIFYLPKLLYETALEALFPISPTEKCLLSMSPESIWQTLPRAKTSPINESCSVFSYKDERVWRLVWAIKYKKSKRASVVAGYALSKIIQTYLKVIPTIVIVPMPISKQRRRERGFNQCELMTNEIDRLAGIGLQKNTLIAGNEKKLLVINDLLIRKKHTSRQTLKDKSNREENVQDLFGINQKIFSKIVSDNCIPNENIFVLVIDDVVTTGSTMREAIQTMRTAGFKDTWGLSVAH